jgi:hypothetical protein
VKKKKKTEGEYAEAEKEAEKRNEKRKDLKKRKIHTHTL